MDTEPTNLILEHLRAIRSEFSDARAMLDRHLALIDKLDARIRRLEQNAGLPPLDQP